MKQKRGRTYPSKARPWDSGDIHLKDCDYWAYTAQCLVRVDRIEVHAGEVRGVSIGNLRVSPQQLPFPTLEAGMTIVVTATVGARFRLTGVQVK